MTPVRAVPDLFCQRVFHLSDMSLQAADRAPPPRKPGFTALAELIAGFCFVVSCLVVAVGVFMLLTDEGNGRMYVAWTLIPSGLGGMISAIILGVLAEISIGVNCRMAAPRS